MLVLLTRLFQLKTKSEAAEAGSRHVFAVQSMLDKERQASPLFNNFTLIVKTPQFKTRDAQRQTGLRQWVHLSSQISSPKIELNAMLVVVKRATQLHRICTVCALDELSGNHHHYSSV